MVPHAIAGPRAAAWSAWPRHRGHAGDLRLRPGDPVPRATGRARQPVEVEPLPEPGRGVRHPGRQCAAAHLVGSAAVARHPAYVSEYVAYLGWPLLLILVIAAVRYWRDVRVRVAAVACAVLGDLVVRRYPGGPRRHHPPGAAALALAGPPAGGQPDAAGPAVHPGDGLAAVVLAVALDLTLSAAQQPRWRRQGLPLALAAIAGLPVIPLPMLTIQVATLPSGYRAAFTRLALPRDARVLVVPVPFGRVSAPLRWYAETGYPGSANGGYFIRPEPQRLARATAAAGPRPSPSPSTRCGTPPAGPPDRAPPSCAVGSAAGGGRPWWP